MHRLKMVVFSLFISIVILVSCALVLAEESISITTYYPSPYGVYNEMRLYPHSIPITSCDSTTEGTMFYNDSAQELQVCTASGLWKSGGGFWVGSGNDIYNTNSGNVGIGTNTPEFKLSFENEGGIISKGTLGAGANLVTAGSGVKMMWYPRKAAFRAGGLDVGSGTQWNNARIGNYSVAFGKNS